MAKTKKELTAIEKLHKAFKEDFDDNELQDRFDNFEKTVKDFKQLYNILVPQINEQINHVNALHSMIIESAKIGFLNREAVNQLKEIEASLKEQTEAADSYKERFLEEEALIKKYEESTHNKLFHYWKAFKAIAPETEPWLEWKRQYDKRIF
jgi:hypothetical protein